MAMTLVFGLFQTIFVAGWLTISALQRRIAGVGSAAYAFFGFLMALWAIGELLVMVAHEPEGVLIARRTFFFAAAFLPPTWFWLGTRAAKPRWSNENPKRVAYAFLTPAFFYSCLYWDSAGNFVHWTAMPPVAGPWFDLYTLYQYGICVAGAAYCIQAGSRLGRSNLRTLGSIAIGVALPITANLFYYLDVMEQDWTAVALGPAAVLVWLAALHSGVASSVPIDRESVIDQLDVGVVVADPSGRIVSANPAAERLADAGSLCGMLLPEAVAAAEQRPEMMIESRAIALTNRLGVTGHALILSDRTDAEAARRRLEIGGRLEALGSLTAGIAHEVNNPLAFIQANLSALESTAKELGNKEFKRTLPEPLQESVADMAALVEETQEGVERIRLLVQRLKTFARTPDVHATAVEVDLDRALRQAAAIATIGQPGHPVDIQSVGGLRVISSETAVFQILVNLLLNAVQAAPDRPSVHVLVRAKGAGVEVLVEDEGPGIAKALLPRIFDPFFTTKSTGTGLGLSLSYDLAEQLGGSLSAGNSEGGGACFSLWLPNNPPMMSAEESCVASPRAQGVADMA